MRRAIAKNPFAVYLAFLGLLCCALFSCGARAQGTVQGQEKVISYTGTNASLVPPNTPASAFTAPLGTTTFILPLANPTAAVRLYITNDTAVVCTGNFTVQFFSATDPQTNTFNGALTNWQVVPAQDPLGSGQLVGITGLLSIPASGALYITSTAIAAPKVAIQIVNNNAGCAGATFEVTAVVTAVSVTSPLVSANSPTSAFGNASNVQGVIPTTQNGSPVFPIVDGGLLPGINVQFTTVGLDNFSTVGTVQAGGTTTTISFGNPPRPTKTNDWGLAYTLSAGSVGTTTFPLSPWACAQPGDTACGFGGFTPPQSTVLANVSSLNTLQGNTNNSNAGANLVTFLEFNVASGTPSIRQTAHGNGANPAYGSNTLAGSTLAIAMDCATGPFVPGTITDTQGNKWVQLVFSTSGSAAMAVFLPTNLSSAAADTLTIAGESCGANFNWRISEIVGVAPASKNTPLAANIQTNNTLAPGEDDTGAQVTSPGLFDSTNTVTLGTGTTTINLFQQNQHGLMFSCTVALRITAASGTAPTLNTYFQDSADGIGWNDRMSFPQGTVAGNFIGAVSGGSGGITPVLTTDGALAVSTKVDGPLAAYGRLKFVVAGTTPSFTVTVQTGCR